MSGFPSEKDEGHNRKESGSPPDHQPGHTDKYQTEDLHLKTEEAEKFKYSDTYKLKQVNMTLKHAGFSLQNTH